MNKLILTGALIALGSVCVHNTSFGHGGTYRGPGDTVPPGAGGGGGGGPASPTPGAPSSPGTTGPATPGPAAPGAPSTGGPLGRPTTGAPSAQPDLTLWQFWWGFNKDPYLNLKAHIHSVVVTGSEDFFSGDGSSGKGRDIYRPNETTIRTKVVPEMFKALETEQSNHIITGAMVALAKIGDVKTEGGKSEFAEKIKPFLASKNAEISETAAVSLGILANDSPEIIDLLAALLANDGAKVRDTYKIRMDGEIAVRVRAFAAYGLGLIGAYSTDEGRKQTIVNALAKEISKSGRSSQRDIPVACIESIGLVPLAWDAADDGPKTGKATELKTRNDQLRFLLDYFRDDSQEHINRAHAPTSMGRLLAKDVPDDSKLRGLLVKSLTDNLSKDSKAQQEIQQSCMLALGQIGDCDNEPIDLDIRKTVLAAGEVVKDQQTKFFSMIAAAQIGGRPGNGDEPLAGMKDVRKYLLEFLDKGKSAERSWAGLSVGVMERALEDNQQQSQLSPDMRKAVATAMAGSKAPQEIGAFAIAMGLMRDVESKNILRDKFEKISDNDAKGYCAVGLGLMNDQESIKPIQEVIKKSKYQPDLLRSAAIGLGLLGDKSIVPDLVVMLADAQGQAPQAAIASALGFIGDSRSVDPLLAFMENKQNTDGARGFAAAALGIVADKEPLPWNSKISTNINYRASTATLTSPAEGTGLLDIL